MKLLIVFLMYIAWCTSVYMCISAICSKKFKITLKSILLITLSATIYYFITKVGIILFRTAFSFITILIFTSFILKNEKRNGLVCTLIYYILVAIAKIVFSIVFVCVLKSNPLKYVASVSFSKMIICTLIMLVLTMISKTNYVRRLYKKICDMAETLKIRSEFILVFIIMLSVLLSFYILNIVGDVKFIYTILYLIILLVFIIYFFISLYQNYYLKILNNYFIEKEKEYQRLLDEYKMFKHNIKHELNLLKCTDKDKQMKIIDTYINEYSTYEELENVASLPNSLRAIIYKKAIFNNNNLKVIVDSFVNEDPIVVLSLKRFIKMVESIGIIVDNAYENVCNGKTNYVYIYLSEDNNKYTFKCVNKICSDYIDIDSFGEKGKSTKNGHEGIGLYYIKSKTDFKLKNCIQGNKYISQLNIKK